MDSTIRDLIGSYHHESKSDLSPRRFPLQTLARSPSTTSATFC